MSTATSSFVLTFFVFQDLFGELSWHFLGQNMLVKMFGGSQIAQPKVVRFYVKQYTNFDIIVFSVTQQTSERGSRGQTLAIPQGLVMRSIGLGWILIYRNWSIIPHSFSNVSNIYISHSIVTLNIYNFIGEPIICCKPLSYPKNKYGNIIRSRACHPNIFVKSSQ